MPAVAAKGRGMKPMPKGPPVRRLEVEEGELDHHGEAEGGDGEIVGAQPDGDGADEEGEEPGGDGAAGPADGDGQAEAAEAGGGVGRGEEGGGVGADGDEAGDADVEEAGLPPLQVQAEADDRVAERHGQEEGAVAEEVEHQSALPKMPCGRRSRMATRMTKATAARHSAPTSCTVDRLGDADDQAGEHGARHAADAAEDGGGEERQQEVEAHLRADLHQEPGHDAGDAGERGAERPGDADHPARRRRRRRRRARGSR